MDTKQQQNKMTSWKEAHGGGFVPLQKEIERLEVSTKLLKSFQISLVPGLLQTPAYAEWIISGVTTDFSPSRHIPNSVKARLRRQAILENPNKLFQFVIYEPAIARAVPSGLMGEQLEHIKVVSQQDNVQLGVIPLENAVPVIPAHSFSIYDDEFVLVETVSQHLEIGDAWDVGLYIKTYELLKDAAQFGEEAEKFLDQLAKR